MNRERKAPLCRLCGVRDRQFDGEPPLSKKWENNFFDRCAECASLVGYRDHTHTYYGSPAQIRAGSVKAGHSWRTTVLLVPIMDNGVHVGFRCMEFDLCGWEQRFSAADMELCDWEHRNHMRFLVPAQYKVLCTRSQDHRVANGECDERGAITEYGRQVERELSDAANWDPGHYVGRR